MKIHSSICCLGDHAMACGLVVCNNTKKKSQIHKVHAKYGLFFLPVLSIGCTFTKGPVLQLTVEAPFSFKYNAPCLQSVASADWKPG